MIVSRMKQSDVITTAQVERPETIGQLREVFDGHTWEAVSTSSLLECSLGRRITGLTYKITSLIVSRRELLWAH
jgi:hypothetical protein